jgi:transcriptional regulator with XRE-family HTH domain
MEVGDTGIGARVSAARERLGWSREALAFHSGISWSGIAQVESGRRRNLRLATLSALAETLGVTIDYLVAGAPATAPLLQHQALVYASDEELVTTAGSFLAGGVERSEAVLAVMTSPNLGFLREHMGREEGRIDFVDSENLYASPSAALDGYKAVISAKLEGGAPWVRIVGEAFWVGASDADVRLWTRYESLVNLVLAAWPVSFICTYDARSRNPDVMRQACLTHPQTIGPEGIAASLDYTDPGEFALDG